MALDVYNLANAIAEAQRFIVSAENAISRIREEGEGPLICGSKETASARRASLDLTRVLADLRRG